ncbi:MAG: hypothetical protein PHR45_01615 [Muribaculaceae bacterium]|nr:hypothetical protein [Muribaculaceae bacterium]
MKIIAESSSTRTEWVLADGNEIQEHAFTEGLNPYFQTRREISHSIRLELPEAFFKRRWDHVYFYGAGCANTEKKKIVEASLIAQFKTPATVESDLLGAARGLLVNNPGIACILGTGSNSCLYDGTIVKKNVRPAGFILGDEGSGAALGKLFISDCLKSIAPEDLMNEFYEKFQVSPDSIMDTVYSKPFPNRSLSTYSFFLSEHLDNEYVSNLVTFNIRKFFERNIAQYDYKNVKVCFVGSLACIYSAILKSVAKEYDIEISKIVRCSMPGLIEYHSDM